MNHTPCAVMLLDPELIQVCNAVGQRASGAAWLRVRWGRWVL
jgi:hypothetical protein